MITLTSIEHYHLKRQLKIGGVVVSRAVYEDVLKFISQPVSDVVTALVIKGADEKTVHAAAELTVTAIVKAITDQVVKGDQISNCEDE
ncbi:hypothetical protein CGH97_23590 [Vibrio parahaemolyticus]|uniref:hypothetical protein n=1 Tax=Vibrio parahaemolyticus TaxID=670 RepID=UPI0011219B65|nr:hypothetical protein [Vibrio parahaemolyticus]TOL45262.1 hypothetical protein CGH97_23590 [Vibrio parahaemolyticus]HEM8140331.1 hypothetical protein [Providencia rettgeri]